MMTGNRNLFSLLCIFLCIVVSCVSGLRDDWYSFGSFEDPHEWASTYRYTCNYNIDLFREPREFSQRNRLQGRREIHSPIRFSTKDTIRAPENVTLHIYNNPGIRGGYSLAYGFQPNKECLHGQDSECVVYPELGRIRALVLNAERFGDYLSLNYLKDRFLIEKPEHFVTILNGGSQFERKFYEAVFLGGFNDDPERSSHQIDGKTYPLEIYMYFLDETVPSVSLSTILVTLVEVSDNDNTQVRPIVNVVEKQLYDAERRFLNRNQGVIRRERLYHHLDASTYYDFTDLNNRASRKERILQESSDPSVVHEAVFTRYIEPFEKMQALEAELFFLLEDLEHGLQEFQRNAKFMHEFLNRRGNSLFPADFTEFHLLIFVGVFRGYILEEEKHMGKTLERDLSCDEFVQEMIVQEKIYIEYPFFQKFRNVTKLPTGDHLTSYVNLCVTICNHFQDMFTKPFYTNKKGSEMLHLSIADKYDLIQDFINERKIRNGPMNKLVYDHVENKTFHPTSAEYPNYANQQQKHEIVTGLYKLLLKREKLEDYKAFLNTTRTAIAEVASRLDYTNTADMQAVIQYLKHGSKRHDLKHFRSKVYKDVVNRELPTQKIKRSIVEHGGMEIAEEEIEKYEQLKPIKISVEQAFQISWLIPHDGGYYYYSGSSPLPPCFRAQNVIVFKKPITMSKRQIQTLTRVPTSFNREEDIHFTTPHVHDTRFEVDLSGPDTEKSRVEEIRVPIYNQPRNHLFLGHDGVHRNAVEQWEKLSKGKNPNRAGRLEKIASVNLILIVMLIQLNF